MKREQVLSKLAKLIGEISCPHPLRVAIDGVDACGKTTLADQLAELLEEAKIPVIRASIDGFHNPREIRYRQGKNSPEGYYHDSFDYPALRKLLLGPLGKKGDGKYQKAKFNFRANQRMESPVEIATPDSILLFDGVFLLRPEIYQYWDFTIFVHADFEITLKRAMERDQYLFGNPQDVKQRYLVRYIPGQKFYLEQVKPMATADVIVHNNNPEDAFLVI